MANRMVVTICGEEYTFVADETAAYMQKVGAYVSDQMSQVLEGCLLYTSDAADEL